MWTRWEGSLPIITATSAFRITQSTRSLVFVSAAKDIMSSTAPIVTSASPHALPVQALPLAPLVTTKVTES